MWHQSCPFFQMIVLNLSITSVLYFSIPYNKSSEIEYIGPTLCVTTASVDPHVQCKEAAQRKPRLKHSLQCVNDQCTLHAR